MTTVIFYKTHYNEKNRPYNHSAFQELFSKGVFEHNEIEVQGTVYPDIPFLIPLDDDIYTLYADGYNYISFTYGEITYYSFITKIEPITPIQQNGKFTYRIFHNTDVWHTFGEKVSLSGIVSRAHVKDYTRNGDEFIPTLEFTNYSVEAELMDDDLVTIENPLEVYSNLTQEKQRANYKWLYILVNKGSKSFGDYIRADLFDRTLRQQRVPLELIAVPYDTEQGYTCKVNAYSGGTDKQLEYTCIKHPIQDLTSTNIVAMYLSDIPATFGITIDGDGTINIQVGIGEKAFDLNDDGKVMLPKITNMILTNYGSLAEEKLNQLFIEGAIDSTDYYFPKMKLNPHYSDDDLKNLSAQDFIRGLIMKTHTSAYLPILIGTQTFTEYSSQDCNFYEIKKFLSPYLDYYVTKVPCDTAEGKALYNVETTTSVFIPFTQNDYWTRLNSKSTEVNMYFDYAKSAVKWGFSLAGGEMQAGAQALQGRYDKAAMTKASTAGDAISGGLGLVQGAYNLVANQQQINRVLNEGIKNLAVPTNASTFIQCDMPQIITHRWRDERRKYRVNFELHKYGYITHIALDDYFSQPLHRRRCFNFVQCSEVVVSGQTTSINHEIEDMFLSGVTLWTTKPMDYNVANRLLNEDET